MSIIIYYYSIIIIFKFKFTHLYLQMSITIYYYCIIIIIKFKFTHLYLQMSIIIYYYCIIIIIKFKFTHLYLQMSIIIYYYCIIIIIKFLFTHLPSHFNTISTARLPPCPILSNISLTYFDRRKNKIRRVFFGPMARNRQYFNPRAIPTRAASPAARKLLADDQSEIGIRSERTRPRTTERRRQDRNLLC